MPSELLTFQEEANGRQRFILPDLMIDYIQEKGGTYSSMTTQHSHLRTFFTHNRVELPPIGNWQPNPTKEPAKGNLNFEQVRQIILHADPRDQAIFVTMLQGLMDLERFTKFNRKYAGALVKHIREKGLDAPFRIDFLGGRKRNPRPFYTYIYHDALAAWQFYFEKERGWPKEDQSIATAQGGAKSPGPYSGRISQLPHGLLPVAPQKARSRGAPPRPFLSHSAITINLKLSVSCLALRTISYRGEYRFSSILSTVSFLRFFFPSSIVT
jgi:hypothetical protein